MSGIEASLSTRLPSHDTAEAVLAGHDNVSNAVVENPVTNTSPDAASDLNTPLDKGTDYDEDREGPRFMFFPELAPELRRMILKLTCFVPRVVDIWCGNVAYNKGEQAFEYLSNSRPLPILHASRETREVALENYTLAFGVELKEKISDEARDNGVVPE